jgi:hypothetical protein
MSRQAQNDPTGTVFDINYLYYITPQAPTFSSAYCTKTCQYTGRARACLTKPSLVPDSRETAQPRKPNLPVPRSYPRMKHPMTHTASSVISLPACASSSSFLPCASSMQPHRPRDEPCTARRPAPCRIVTVLLVGVEFVVSSFGGGSRSRLCSPL